MNIAHALKNAGLFVILDSQAKHRNTDNPEMIYVKHLGNDDIMETVKEASSTYPSFTALVLSTGQVMVLSEYGKGGIAVQGQPGEETSEQLAALETTQKTLSDFFGVAIDGAPKKRSKAKVAPEATTESQEATEATEAATNPEPEQDAPEAESEANQGE